MKMNIGLSDTQRKNIVKGLSRLLASTYTLYLKTHNYHWNVTGPMFETLHKMFEQQYNDLFLANDEIAERIRALGEYAPGSYTEYSQLSVVKEAKGQPKAEAMIKDLLAGHEAIANLAREIFPTSADVNDEATVDLLTQRMQFHEKTAWMLRSLLA